jgi:hypothetical protein
LLSSRAGGSQLSGLDLQLYLRMAESMRLLRPFMEDEDPDRWFLQISAGFADAMEAMMSGQWLPEHDLAFAKLQEVADDDEGIDLVKTALVRFAQAMARGTRCMTMARSPRPEDWPDATEFNEVAAELEAVLDVLPDAGLPPEMATAVGFLQPLTPSIICLRHRRSSLGSTVYSLNSGASFGSSAGMTRPA